MSACIHTGSTITFILDTTTIGGGDGGGSGSGGRGQASMSGFLGHTFQGQPYQIVPVAKWQSKGRFSKSWSHWSREPIAGGVYTDPLFEVGTRTSQRCSNP